MGKGSERLYFLRQARLRAWRSRMKRYDAEIRRLEKLVALRRKV